MPTPAAFARAVRSALTGLALIAACCAAPAFATALPAAALTITAEAAAERWTRENDAAAEDLRAARRADTVAASRRLAAAALVRLDALLATPAPDADVKRRARFDRVVALVAAGREAEAVAAVAALEQEGERLPAYVLSAAGDAHAALEQPAAALARYEAALALAPDDDAAHAGRLYALADLDRLGEAEALLRARIADPAFAATRRADRGRLALLLAWSERLDDALALASQLVAEDPADADARTRHADLLLQADRPDAALREYDTVLAASPDARRARLGRAQAASRAARWDASRADYAALGDDDWTALRRAREAEAIDRAPSLAWDLAFGEGDDRELAARDRRTEVSLTSARSEAGWRAFAGRREAHGEFQGRALEDVRDFVGASLQRGRWRLRAELDRPRDRFDDGLGWTLGADVRLDDAWSLGVSHARDAFDLPLRAREAGITGDRTAAALRWQATARHALRLAGTHVDYSDGNTSRTLGLSSLSRWPLGDTAALRLEPGVYASWQDRRDVPYFSPGRDLSVEVGGAVEHRLWRDGRYRLDHALEFGAGHYRQDGFDGAGIGRVGWRIALARSPGWRVHAGVSRARRVFDGEPEYQTRFELGGWWSFGWKR